jgi:large subunit ribosomal protein L30
VAGSNLKIRQTRSANGTKPNQRATLKALGLGRPGSAVERPDSAQLRGQLRVVEHLVSVEGGD